MRHSLCRNQPLDIPHHRGLRSIPVGQDPHDLIIPKPDHASTGSAQAPQPQRGSRSIPEGDNTFSRRSSSSFCKSWILPSISTANPALSKTPFYLDWMTVKIDDESLNDLPLAPPVRAGVSPKVDSQLIRLPKVPEGGSSSHKIFSAGVISRRSSDFHV